ncbi:GNAT family N-acetyltransferase [Pontivivens insulae]|uniref:N-acetyltransferase domain-containing protein n=1 Tax=Pontivivens insulae TaxID=1639689 RepID=A0A2R8ADU2_9RHOB|nr:GNAT family N-acetyltransferase [Pontivivens insulae]RED14346.1 RimJ/RimL family protein N-acetyltransferase [Pontivivens insulae]SPF30423.1 hypothetical protein POI8812_02759 [Pontivivens insulae]
MSLTATIPTLTTERLTLRAPRREDFPTLAAFYASDRSRHIGGPKDEAASWTILMADIGTWVTHGFGFFAVEHDSQHVGMVGLHHPPHHADLELGWTIFADAEGKGIAQEAAIAARDWARATLPAQRLVSYIDRNNTRSIALAERLGAREIGTPDHDSLCGTWLHPEGTA